MSLILVAEPESRHVQRIRDALTPEGFQIALVDGPESAFAAARDEAPRLVLVSSSAPGADELVRAFARRTGGPGVIALLAETEPVPTGDHPLPADRWLTKPFTEGDLRMAVRQTLSSNETAQANAPSAPPNPSTGGQLTSEDIFGDLVAEVESELAGQEPAAPRSVSEPRVEPSAPTTTPVTTTPATPTPGRPPQASRELDQSLEQTLSGLRRMAPVRPAKRQPLPDSDIDALLSDTLSGLEIKRRPRRPKKPAPTAAPTETPADTPATLTPDAPAAPHAPEAPAAPDAPDAPNARQTASAKPSVVEPPAPEPLPSAEEPVTPPQIVPPPAVSAPPPAVGAPAEQPFPAGADLFAKVEPEPVPPPATPARSLDDSTTAGARRFGQYTLLERIAVGGMAEVWKARMTGVEGFQKTVAIKKILGHLTDDEGFVNMLVDEAKLAAQLNHPNIVHIYDLGKIDDHFYIAMEYVDGMNLRGLLNQAALQGRAVPVGLAALVTSRLAAGLDYAHRKRDFEDRELGLVHRDVSPQNVLLSFDGDIKLCDFGIVKAVSKVGQTQMGALKGKLQYMSPEQAWGKEVDARSDIFSLGALFFEMLTGERLFGGDSEISVLEAVRQCRVRAPRNLDPSLPEEAERIALKALEQNPDRRYQTAGEMHQDLESFLRGLDPSPGQADLSQMIEALGRSPLTAEPSGAKPTPGSHSHSHTGTGSAHPTHPESTSGGVAAPNPAPTAATTTGGPTLSPADPALPTSTAEPVPLADPGLPAPSADGELASTDPTSDSTPLPAAPPAGKSSGVLWAVLLLLLLLVAAATAYLLTRPESGSPAPEATPVAVETPTNAQPEIPPAAPEGEPPVLLADPDDPPAEAPELLTADPTDGPSEEAPGVDLERMVDEAMAEREEALRSEFERREREVARQLEAARRALEASAAEEAAGDAGSGDSEEGDPTGGGTAP